MALSDLAPPPRSRHERRILIAPNAISLEILIAWFG
jgi:hypothetical protein